MATSECCICLSALGEDDVCHLRCSHRFHSSCLMSYFFRGRQRTCPLCRRSVEAEEETSDDGASDRDEIDEIDEIDDLDESSSLSPDEEELPQWLALSWRDAATRRQMLLQKRVAKELLRRAAAARAPAVLKRCLERHRALQREARLVSERTRRMLSQRRRVSVREALNLHRKQRGLQRRSSERCQRHLKEVLQRCQRSVAARAYFCSFPLKEF